MFSQAEVLVRPAITKDRSQLASLLHFETYVHRHLDWRPPLDWLGYEPYVVMERGGRITAALACPPDPPSVAWVRMFVSSAMMPPEKGWEMLWHAARHLLAEQEVKSVAAIPLQKWFRELLETSGFEHVHNVVLLVWDRDHEEHPKPTEFAHIRRMQRVDLDAVATVDAASFGPIWRNSRELLELAFKQALVATVAEIEDRIIGYQISTPSPIGAHLARLAVHPDVQGQGIGYALARDLIEYCKHTRNCQVSVNTQHNNAKSLALYNKAGFSRTGEKFPVFEYDFSS
ncbi:MAG: GNAT family N-acetyltransferase [Anaerolineales bacterium]|nr:GNAT family N-acetyltransferase [Anaerolineales bacterium]